MIFSPFSFVATAGTLTFNAIGCITGSYSSGGIDYQFHKFTSSANFIVTQGSNQYVSMLIVGGGAGADNNGASVGIAGGGGGILYTSSFTLGTDTYSVTVGAGGAQGQNGESSSISAASI